MDGFTRKSGCPSELTLQRSSMTELTLKACSHFGRSGRKKGRQIRRQNGRDEFSNCIKQVGRAVRKGGPSYLSKAGLAKRSWGAGGELWCGSRPERRGCVKHT